MNAAGDACFVDTGLLLYSFDPADPVKHAAAAENLGCRWLLSEDFQDGGKYGSVHVIDPFRTDPQRFFTGRAQ